MSGDLDPTEPDHRPVFKNRYQVERELGRGGMSVVYLARDLQLLDKRVVVKVLLDESPEKQFKLKQELEALILINHHGVVGANDSGETSEGRQFLVMEHIEGQTLRKAIKDGPLDFSRAANILRQVGDALSAVHAKNVCHRDLTPENIMLQELPNGKEHVKLIDFGIASVQDSVFGAGKDSTFAGKVSYMSPEQMDGKPNKFSDIFAMGICAYEILAGEKPFTSEEHLYSAEKCKPQPPQTLRSGLTESAGQAILKAIAFSAQDRYPSASDFGETLANALTAKEHQRADTKPLEVGHVLFTDLVGYSLLPLEQQREYLAELQSVVKDSEAFKKALARQNVTTLNTGDGMALAFFGEPTQPATCALDIGKALQCRPHLKLRMGIHSGPVYKLADINTSKNLAGGGINIAQRVMESSSAGQVVVSETTATILQPLKLWNPLLTDLGMRTVMPGEVLRLYDLAIAKTGKLAPNIYAEREPTKMSRHNNLILFYLKAAIVIGVFLIGYLLRQLSVPSDTNSEKKLESSAAADDKLPRTNPTDGLTYVWIPPGKFQMGCSPGDSECGGDETPVQVKLTKGFWLGETEVTQGAYAKVTGKEPSLFKGPNLPVENVDWNQAQAYCTAIGGKLPTEAQWEYAARGGLPQASYGALAEIAWFYLNSGAKTHPVKTEKKPNAYGLYNMLGNVWEWTSDWYVEKLQGGTDPAGPVNGEKKVVRGGSWVYDPSNLRVSYRDRDDASNHVSNLGFRCVWE